MMKRQLYIFITSNAPDLYINVLRHCVQHFDLDKEIYFVGVLEDSDKEEDTEKYLDIVIQRTKEQIINLTKGEYFSTKEKKVIQISIEEHHKRRYTALLDFKLTPRPILYKNIEKELQKYITNGIFDVSGFQKDYLVDVYTILHLFKNSNVFYFKIKKLKDRTFDDKELIHNLTLHTDYEFENISESFVTRGTSVIRNNTIEEVIKKDNQIIKLTEDWANSYASIWTNIVRAFLAIVLIVGVIMFYKNIDNWEKMEPWTFLLLTPVIWIVNLTIQVFIGKGIQDALTFNNLKNFIKKRKKQLIEKNNK